MRLKSAQLTNANVSSSWPTPAAHEARLGFQNCNNGEKGTQKSLTTVVIETGPSDQANPNTNGKSQESWPTPQAQNFTTRGNERKGELGLLGQVKEQWPTPTAMSRPRSEETMEKCLKFRQSKGKNTVPLYLEEKVKKEESWATPTQDGNYNRKGASKHSGDGIATQVQNWPTPRETMSRDVDHDRGKGNLGEKVQSKGMKLNPNWVEQLMGLPVGWTQLPTAWIG